MKKWVSLIAVILTAAASLYAVWTGKDAGLAALVREDILPAQIAAAQTEGIAPRQYIRAVADRVIDGDTIEVSYRRKNYKVRLLYIDTPESVKGGVPVQPWSEEATVLVKKLALGENIKLVFDAGLRDRYDRLLAYVILEDGSCLNAMLVRNGYARVEAVQPNTVLKDWFYDLQNKAEAERLGFWSLPETRRPFIRDQRGRLMPKYEMETSPP